MPDDDGDSDGTNEVDYQDEDDDSDDMGGVPEDDEDDDGDTTVGPTTVGDDIDQAADAPEEEDEEEHTDVHACAHCVIPFSVEEAEIGVSVVGRATAICPSCGYAQPWPFRDRERVMHLDEAFIRRQANSLSSSNENTSTGKGN